MSRGKKMLREKLYELKNWKGVIHTTWNPGGPGALRIHMVPPKFVPFKRVRTPVILNGQDILPINESWAILLTEFIKHTNDFGDGPMSDEDLAEILGKTIKGVKRVYPGVREKVLRDDLDRMMDVFETVVRGDEITMDGKPVTLEDYVPYMTAPHRMDLMVSAMTRDGNWHCNQKCIHCYAAGQELASEKELSTPEWKKIIELCRKAKIPQLTFTGGEPTMRDDIPELIASAKWFVTRLNTNGVKLTPEYCRKLHDAELDNVQVTFYSSDPEIHNRLVGAPNYEKTLEGIKNVMAAGLNISINTPLCTLNADYAKTLAFLHDLGITYVTCSGMIPTGGAAGPEAERIRLTKEEITDCLKKAVDYCYANDMEISFTSPGWVEEEVLQEMGLTIPSCGACLSNMAISPSGNVIPCQSWLSGEPLGNMLTDDWNKIWNSEQCRKVRGISSKNEKKCQLQDKRNAFC